MGAMAHPEPVFHTAEMVRALIDEERGWPRHETFYGELVVTPAPRWPHQWIVGVLHAELLAYLRREPVGVALVAPADISWARPDVLVQPDVFVVPRTLLGAMHETMSWTAVTHLLLAVEIASPSTARRDRFAKRVLYQRQGVETYWALDPERQVAEVWTPEATAPVTVGEQLVWHPPGAREPLVLALASLLALPSPD